MASSDQIFDVACLTLAFVCLMEATILTVSWRGLKEAQNLRRKLDPVFRIFDTMPPGRIEKAAKYLDRKFAEWAKAQEEFDAELLRGAK